MGDVINTKITEWQRQLEQLQAQRQQLAAQLQEVDISIQRVTGAIIGAREIMAEANDGGADA